MRFATLALIALITPGFDEKPAELVAKLGSHQYAEREAAAGAIRRLGPAALPALREARSSTDLEIKTRALTIIDEIVSTAILSPPPIKLDFHDQPLAEVIDAVGRRGGFVIKLGDEQPVQSTLERRSWPDRRITLEAAEPLTYWDAIDRLCRLGGLRRLYPSGYHFLGAPPGQLILAEGKAAPPNASVGPIRVELIRIRRERSLDLTPGLTPRNGMGGMQAMMSGPNVNEIRNSDEFAELVISADPRLGMFGMSNIENPIAVDARGRSILRQPTAQERKSKEDMLRMNPHLDPQIHPEVRFGSGYRSSSNGLSLRIPLADSTPPGTRLAELKGKVAVALIARVAEPLVVALGNPAGKPIEKGGLRVTIHEAFVKPSYFQGELDLTLETDQPGRMIKVQGPAVPPVEINRPLDYAELQMEILDDQGRLLQWGFSQQPSDGNQGRMRLMVQPPDPGKPVDFSKLQLRVYELAGAAIEVPFRFTDLPMP